jgi:hypothetical protein
MRFFKALLFTAALWVSGVGLNGAQQIVTATVTITNVAGTVAGETISVNGTSRLWTNAVSAVQVVTNGTISGAASNLFSAYAQFPEANLVVSHPTSNTVVFQSFPGFVVTVALSSGWATNQYTTNTLTSAVVVRVPMSVEGAAQQTNISSGLVAWIDFSGDTNALHESSPAVQNLMGLTNAQTVAGKKSLTNTANIYYGIGVNLKTTNLVNYGSAISSPSAGSLQSEQFGNGASAGVLGALAVGAAASASGGLSTAVGNGSSASGANATALGEASAAAANNSTALGNATVIGATHLNSTAVGYAASTTTSNQVMLGSAGISVVVNNQLAVTGGSTFGGALTNLTHSGTNNYPAGSDIAFGRYALTTLANGINQDIVIGTNVVVDVTGPTAAFSIEGIAGGRDGKLAIIVSTNAGFNMTIATEGGATGNDPTPANRIISLSGADRTTTGPGAAILWYHGTYQRWILLSFEP